MTGLNTKTLTTHDKIDLVNAKLDTLIGLLGGAPPTPTATLDDVVAALVTLNDNVVLLDTSLGAINDELTLIRTYIKDPAETELVDSHQSLMYNLLWLRKAIATISYDPEAVSPVQVGIAEFQANQDTLISTTNALINSMQGTFIYAMENLGLDTGGSPSYVYYGWLAQALNWMAKISGSEGLPIDGGNQNIIELLYKIANRPESQIGSGLVPNEVCDDAYISTGMTLVPYSLLDVLQDINFAVFDSTPPSDIDYGSVFGLGVDHTELVNTSVDGWEDWYIYVASSAPNFALNALSLSGSLRRYPSNVWISLSFLTTNLSVFVNGVDSLKVYLCGGGWAPATSSGGPWSPDPEEPPPPLETFELTSEATTYQNDYPFSSSTQGIIWAGVAGITSADSMTSNGTPDLTESFSDSDGVCLTNLTGWTITMLAGDPSIVVIWVDLIGDRHFDMLDNISDSVELTDTQGLMILYPAGNGSSTPFTIELAPPV